MLFDKKTSYKANDHSTHLLVSIPDRFIEAFRIEQSQNVIDGILIFGPEMEKPGNMISFRATEKTMVSFKLDKYNPDFVSFVEISELGRFSIYMDYPTSGSLPLLTCVIW